ncbi:hypothetical protein [Streptomyces sp. NPDC040750]|uniref:hypothetical protein n=1 Tax=Streptomyces sp. NPDC040750 TaxID=3154491 RepID=UPI0033C0E23A
MRNTLEALASKNTIIKTNQQGSAMYTAHEGGTDAAADGETAQAGEKVPAQV